MDPRGTPAKGSGSASGSPKLSPYSAEHLMSLADADHDARCVRLPALCAPALCVFVRALLRARVFVRERAAACAHVQLRA